MENNQKEREKLEARVDNLLQQMRQNNLQKKMALITTMAEIRLSAELVSTSRAHIERVSGMMDEAQQIISDHLKSVIESIESEA